MRKKKIGKKREKTHLVFNEEERKSFLLGFHKRKKERQLKAKEELTNMMKEQRKKIKQQQKDALYETLKSQRTVPEIEHLLDSKTYDLPDHTVTISEVQDLDPFRSLPAEVAEDSSTSGTKNADADDGTERILDKLKRMKQQQQKALKNSSISAASKMLQKKNDKKEARRKRKKLLQSLKKTKKNRQKKKRRTK